MALDLLRNPNYDESRVSRGGGNELGYPTLAGGGNTGGAAPTTGGNSGNGNGGGGGGRAWDGVFNYNLPYLTPFSAPRFSAPSRDAAMNEPGYQFRLGAGMDALQKSAAARGVLRTGGTLKDLVNYNQNFAAQEYNNVYNRALQGFDRNYRAASDEYAPTITQWKTQAAMEQMKAQAEYDAQLQVHLANQRNNDRPPEPPPA